MILEKDIEFFAEWLFLNKDKKEVNYYSGNTGVIIYVPVPELIFRRIKDIDEKDGLEDALHVLWDQWSDYCINKYWLSCIRNRMTFQYELILEIEFTHEYARDLYENEKISNLEANYANRH